MALNAAMFVIGVTAGLLADSSGLIADGLDMLADASAYAIALAAVGRSIAFKRRAATGSGALLLILGIGVLLDVARRFAAGADPQGLVMIAVAAVALTVNASVLRMLGALKSEGVHLRATWIFTRVDVIANIAVIISGLAVMATGSHVVDLVVGGCIGLYVVKEAMEILMSAKRPSAS